MLLFFTGCHCALSAVLDHVARFQLLVLIPSLRPLFLSYFAVFMTNVWLPRVSLAYDNNLSDPRFFFWGLNGV